MRHSTPGSLFMFLNGWSPFQRATQRGKVITRWDQTGGKGTKGNHGSVSRSVTQGGGATARSSRGVSVGLVLTVLSAKVVTFVNVLARALAGILFPKLVTRFRISASAIR